MWSTISHDRTLAGSTMSWWVHWLRTTSVLWTVSIRILTKPYKLLDLKIIPSRNETYADFQLFWIFCREVFVMSTGNHRRILKFFDQGAITIAIFMGLILSFPDIFKQETLGLIIVYLLVTMFLWFLLAEAFDAYERNSIYRLRTSISSILKPMAILSLISLIPSIFIRGWFLDVLRRNR